MTKPIIDITCQIESWALSLFAYFLETLPCKACMHNCFI